MPLRHRLLYSRKTVALGPTLSLHAPLVQATLGASDGPRLAAAVSRAGGLGTLTVHAPSLRRLRRELRTIREITPRPVQLAFTAPWERDEVLETVLAAGFRHFQVCWWNGPRLAPHLIDAGATVLWQVGTVDQAKEALNMGAAILTAQGTEAGGQVRSPQPLFTLISQLREMLGNDIPIIAGGGLSDKRDVQAILSAGANAALLGTRFLLSEESAAAARYKARLLRATPKELILDTRLVGDWPCAPRRYLPTALGDTPSALSAGLGIGLIRSLYPASDLVRLLTPR